MQLEKGSEKYREGRKEEFEVVFVVVGKWVGKCRKEKEEGLGLGVWEGYLIEFEE